MSAHALSLPYWSGSRTIDMVNLLQEPHRFS
jgi:hypothetical protein